MLGCEKDINDANALKDLLDENSLEILPYWKDDGENSNFKFVFNSYEATFYLFLYLKDRLDEIKSFDEALFAKNNEGEKYAEDTLNTTISRVYDDADFRPASLIKTFENACENACENFILNEYIIKLFLGKSDIYDNKNSFMDAFNDVSFKKELFVEYGKLIPYLTAGTVMCEHFKGHHVSGNGEDFQIKIMNYFENNFDYDKIKNFSYPNKIKLLGKASRLALNDMKDGKYVESSYYYNRLLKKATIFVIYRKVEDSLLEEAYENKNFDKITTFEPGPRMDMICDCIHDIMKEGEFHFTDDEIQRAVGHQLVLNLSEIGDFNYEIFKKIVFDTFYELMETNNLFYLRE